ncbi:ABC transporter ATP-binding protein [Sphingomonas ginkgonis]|uniref:ABC transporter ATP-binding protein n=1 Tax=Sphingomonas ginkgonis TaxID=2315330 RepID=A0A3R9YMF0_9SPHN|nr:ABC transporter ATP-binding protein [Sphingomonas ginkgonis]RST31082.1 ABC transporter ATP-binding protein [Sphingomonas ginkgonis]
MAAGADALEADAMTALLAADRLEVAGRLQPTGLTLSAGALAAVIGPNGGGKTSLLRALAGIDPEASGTVRVAGEELGRVAPARRRQLLAYLPASRDAHWPIAAQDVIALGLDRPDPARVEELMAALEVSRFAERPLDRLSTGERARVLLARALAGRPRVLLLDEPLANLDPWWVLRTLELLGAEAGRGAAVLVALHDLAQAPRFERLLLMHEGRVTADGDPAHVLDSASFAEAFRLDAVELGLRPSADPRSSP